MQRWPNLYCCLGGDVEMICMTWIRKRRYQSRSSSNGLCDGMSHATEFPWDQMPGLFTNSFIGSKPGDSRLMNASIMHGVKKVKVNCQPEGSTCPYHLCLHLSVGIVFAGLCPGNQSCLDISSYCADPYAVRVRDLSILSTWHAVKEKENNASTITLWIISSLGPR